MGKVERRGGGVRVFERGKVGCEGWGWGWGGCRDLFDLPHEMRLVLYASTREVAPVRVHVRAVVVEHAHNLALRGGHKRLERFDLSVSVREHLHG